MFLEYLEDSIVMIKSRVWGTLLGALLLVQSAFAAPAIQDANFSGTNWTAVGVAGGSSVSFGQTNANIHGGDPSFGLIVGEGGGLNGLVRDTFFSNITYGVTSIGAANSSFGSAFTNTARMVGVYQEFTTGELGNISFDAVAFGSEAGQDGDAFAFLYNTTTNTGTFVRGGNSVSGFGPNLVDGSGGVSISSAQSPDYPDLDFVYGSGTVASRLAGVTYTFSNIAAGNYIIGFGFGSASTATGVFGGFAVNNIQSPNAIPEIDTASAGLPLALALMLFLVVGDRRRRGGVSLG